MSPSVGRRKKRVGRGQALVEFALVAPLLFLLIIGIVEIGRLVFFYHIVNEAAREGARYAIVHGENAFDGCPSGPLPGGETNTCDPDASKICDRIVAAAAPALVPTCGWWPDDCDWPLYGRVTPPATAPDCTDQFNHKGNDVTIHVEYAYSPIVLLDLFGTVTLRAEATLVINN